MRRILMMLAFVGIALPALAQETPPESPATAAGTPQLKYDRKGIVLGAGVGSGIQMLYYNTMNRSGVPIMGDIKVGYGVTNRILVLFNPSIMRTKYDSLGFFTFQFPVAAQFYVFKDLYLRPGVGVAYTTRSFTQFMVAQTITSKITVGASLAAGWEFRLLNGRLGLSPELVYHYDRISNGFNVTQSNTIGGQINVLSYFKIR